MAIHLSLSPSLEFLPKISLPTDPRWPRIREAQSICFGAAPIGSSVAFPRFGGSQANTETTPKIRCPSFFLLQIFLEKIRKSNTFNASMSKFVKIWNRIPFHSIWFERGATFWNSVKANTWLHLKSTFINVCFPRMESFVYFLDHSLLGSCIDLKTTRWSSLVRIQIS